MGKKQLFEMYCGDVGMSEWELEWADSMWQMNVPSCTTNMTESYILKADVAGGGQVYIRIKIANVAAFIVN